MSIATSRKSFLLASTLFLFCCVAAAQPLTFQKELAAALATAKTDEERRRLLTENRELLTVELREALLVQSEALRKKGNFAQALAVLDVTQHVAEQIDDKKGLAIVLRSIGTIHVQRGDYVKGLNYYQQSKTLAELLGDKAEIARVLNNIGIVYRAQGNYEQALNDYQRSLTLKEALGDRAGVAATLNNIGAVYQSQGAYDHALDNYQQSLRLKELLADRAGIAVTLGNIGNVHQLQGNYAQALNYYRQSLALCEQLGSKNEIVALALSNIGNVHQSQGNHEQALNFYRKSVALNELLGNKAGLAITLGNIGAVYQSQDNFEQALPYYQKSLTLKEALGDKSGIAITLGNLGAIHQANGNYEQALNLSQKSLELFESLGDKEGIANALSNIGIFYRKQGRLTEALDFARRATTLARQIGSLEVLWTSQLTAGKVYTSLGQPGPARELLTAAIETIETMRTQVAGSEQDSQRFFENKLSPYLAMAELLISQNNANEALTYAERAKSRVLLDVLRSGRSNITKAMTVLEQEQERQALGKLVSLNSQVYRESLRAEPDQRRLADLQARLQTARLDYEALQSRLYASHPELKVKRGEALPLELNEVAVLLPDARSAVLEYLVTEQRTYLFVLTKDSDAAKARASVSLFTLNVSAKELSERAAGFRRQLARHDLLYRKSAVELYELLLKPAHALLKGKRLLTIVPDGMLWEMPFQALQPIAGRHLIEESAIAYAPSLTVLSEMSKERSKRRGAKTPMSLLAVGNPMLGTQNVERFEARPTNSELTPLPEAEEQVKALQLLYGAEHSKVYLGAEAREERVKLEAGNYRILHLATHGILDDASPMYSYVVLADEGANTREDGFLEAWEIMNLDLDADLVVLSACETARGRVGAGEGMIGFTWALFVAGSPSTVVSQWKVDAASTATLMLEFHRSLRANNSRARALQQAALKVLRDKRYQHPFYWAPFVLIGDAN